ncbi:MAG: AAA family ATPase, partial [bacterium]|nr:AAA family ATPase [bacterium]
REINNVLEQALSSLEGSTIHLHHLPLNLYRNQAASGSTKPTLLKDILASTEKEALIDALKETGNNKAQAAALLGIHRTLLYKKMKKYNISFTLDK